MIRFELMSYWIGNHLFKTFWLAFYVNNNLSKF